MEVLTGSQETTVPSSLFDLLFADAIGGAAPSEGGCGASLTVRKESSSGNVESCAFDSTLMLSFSAAPVGSVTSLLPPTESCFSMSLLVCAVLGSLVWSTILQLFASSVDVYEIKSQKSMNELTVNEVETARAR